MVITLKGYGNAGWYWSVKTDEMIVRAGWSSTLPGAWWRATRARKQAEPVEPDPG